MNTQWFFAVYLAAYAEASEFGKAGIDPRDEKALRPSSELEITQIIDLNSAIVLGTYHATKGKEPLGFFDFSQAWQALRNTDQQQ